MQTKFCKQIVLAELSRSKNRSIYLAVWMSKIMAGKIRTKPRAGILEFKLVHPRSTKASTYFIRYTSSSRGGHADSRGQKQRFRAQSARFSLPTTGQGARSCWGLYYYHHWSQLVPLYNCAVK